MLKQVLVLTAAVALGGLLTAALMDRPAVAQSSGDHGRFEVVASGPAFIMYDSVGGNFSWVAFPQAGDKRFAWLPMTRLDSEAKAAVWRSGKSEKPE
jgi:hypothetical protein